MPRKTKNTKRCLKKKSSYKNGKGKGGIFSCMDNASNSGKKSIGRKRTSAPESKTIFRENSQKSSDINDYSQFVVTDIDLNPSQTRISENPFNINITKINKGKNGEKNHRKTMRKIMRKRNKSRK
jgi:hypothetical protein